MVNTRSLILAGALALAFCSAAHAQAYDSDPNQQNTSVSINGAESTTDRPTVLDFGRSFDGGPVPSQATSGGLFPVIPLPFLQR